VFDPMHTRGFGSWVPVRPKSDVIRWSIQGGAGIPLCTFGTICQVQLHMAPGGWHNTLPAAVIQAVCIATPGSARINVACRLHSADELY
jgi:hypothetical protein